MQKHGRSRLPPIVVRTSGLPRGLIIPAYGHLWRQTGGPHHNY